MHNRCDRHQFFSPPYSERWGVKVIQGSYSARFRNQVPFHKFPALWLVSLQYSIRESMSARLKRSICVLTMIYIAHEFCGSTLCLFRMSGLKLLHSTRHAVEIKIWSISHSSLAEIGKRVEEAWKKQLARDCCIFPWCGYTLESLTEQNSHSKRLLPFWWPSHIIQTSRILALCTFPLHASFGTSPWRLLVKRVREYAQPGFSLANLRIPSCYYIRVDTWVLTCWLMIIQMFSSVKDYESICLIYPLAVRSLVAEFFIS